MSTSSKTALDAFQWRAWWAAVSNSGPIQHSGIAGLGLHAATVALPGWSTALHLAMRADERIWPRLSAQEIDRPVFIVGNPRSGTTFTHRLLALDDENFVAPKLWQILLPAAVQQAAVDRAAKLDSRLGGPMTAALDQIQSRLFSSSDAIHRLRLQAPEEDEAYLGHAYATAFLMLMQPHPETRSLAYFDTLPGDRREEILSFYKGCIQRLLMRAGGRRLMSKNPLFSYKIKSLHEQFPDARFIYLLRRPAEAVASTLSMASRIWKARSIPPEELVFLQNHVVDFLKLLYTEALDSLDSLPEDRWRVLHYEQLIAEPAQSAAELLSWVGAPPSDTVLARLDEAQTKARARKAKHVYTLAEFGVSEPEVENALSRVYDRFGYERRTSPAEPQTPPKASRSGGRPAAAG